jgi:hypothetical protein
MHLLDASSLILATTMGIDDAPRRHSLFFSFEATQLLHCRHELHHSNFEATHTSDLPVVQIFGTFFKIGFI